MAPSLLILILPPVLPYLFVFLVLLLKERRAVAMLTLPLPSEKVVVDGDKAST